MLIYVTRILPCFLSKPRWLLENRDEGCTESAVDGACWNGHEPTVRWLMCEWGQAGSERSLDYAASTGRLEVGSTKNNGQCRLQRLVRRSSGAFSLNPLYSTVRVSRM